MTDRGKIRLTQKQLEAVLQHRRVQAAKRSGTLHLVARSFVRAAPLEQPPNTLVWKCSECAWTYKLHREPPIEDALAYHLARNAFDAHDCERFLQGKAA